MTTTTTREAKMQRYPSSAMIQALADDVKEAHANIQECLGYQRIASCLECPDIDMCITVEDADVGLANLTYCQDQQDRQKVLS